MQDFCQNWKMYCSSRLSRNRKNLWFNFYQKFPEILNNFFLISCLAKFKKGCFPTPSPPFIYRNPKKTHLFHKCTEIFIPCLFAPNLCLCPFYRRLISTLYIWEHFIDLQGISVIYTYTVLYNVHTLYIQCTIKASVTFWGFHSGIYWRCYKYLR